MTSPSSAYLLGLDLGTTVSKGIVMDAQGQILASAELPVRYNHPHPGWVEADPQHYRSDVFSVISQLAASAPGPITGLAAAAASGNTLLADAAGTPLTNIINWMDQRGVRQKSAALRELVPAAVRQVTGWPCVDIFPLAHLAWLREHQPQIYHRASRVCMSTDWLLFHLSGAWLMDHSTATTFHLQDQCSGNYHQPYLDLLDINPNQLSQLCPSGTSAGHPIRDALLATGLAPDTQIITGSFDHPAAARGVGVLDPGQLLLSCGTSWVGLLPARDRQSIVEAELLCDPFLSGSGGPWAGMFSIPYIGRTINAYVQQYVAPGEAQPYAVFDELAAAAAPGAGGLRIDLREDVKPLQASRQNISRALMEGAAQLLAGKLVDLQKLGFEFNQAVIVGGPSRSPIWADIVAQITGLELAAGTPYSGATGAALLAGIGTGVFADAHSAYQTCRHSCNC